MNISIKSTGNPPSIAGHIGSVSDVIAARVPENLRHRRFKASDFAFGFELGTPKEILSLGESILLNGICYATSTDGSSAEYNKTISGPDFMTSGMFLIPHEAKPSHHAVLREASLPLLDCYTAVYQAVQRPLAFIGLVHFETLHATAIGKPPIDGHNIFEHQNAYYPHPEIKEKNVLGFIIGAITDYRDQPFTEINQQLEVVLYNNPAEKSSDLTYHAHVLTLKRQAGSVHEITPSLSDRVLHVFCAGTSVRSLQVDVFTIQKLKDFS